MHIREKARKRMRAAGVRLDRPLFGLHAGGLYGQAKHWGDERYGEVAERLLDDGYSVVMMMDYVTYALRLAGVARVRVGTGRNNVTRRFLERIKKHEAVLGWRVGEDGWVACSAPPDARP